MAPQKYRTELLSTAGKTLYLNAEKADVFFVCRGERIPAHKLLLSAANEVFETMFYGSLKEGDDIKIVDACADAFKEFLKFFYFTEVELTMKYIDQIINLAKKYDAVDCLNACTAFLNDNLTNHNICDVFRLAILFDQTNLKKICVKKFCTEATAIFGTSSFYTCDIGVLRAILKMNLWSCKEADLFEACMDWVVFSTQSLTRGDVQGELGDLFYQFRFGSLTIEEFAGIVSKYGSLFSSEEYAEIVQMIGSPKYQPKLFNRSPRCNFKWNANAVLDCEREVAPSHWYYQFRDADDTFFSTTEHLLLGQIDCVKLYKNERNERPLPIGTSIGVDLRLIEPSSGEIRNENVEMVVTKFGAKIIIDKPIFIKPKIVYQIKLKLPSDEYRSYTVLGFNSTEIAPKVKVRFHNKAKELNSAEKRRGGRAGLICGLKFNQIPYEV